jgi:hypothetical protein
MILPQVKEFKHIIMPRLDVDSERSRAFVASLIDIAGRRVVSAEHRDDTVGVAIGSSDVRTVRDHPISIERGKNDDDHLPSGTNTMYVQTNSPCSLTDHSTLLQRIVNAIDTVIFHAHQEAT